MIERMRKKLTGIPAATIIVLGMILAASLLRLRLYGDPNLSIAGNDTLSYVQASRVPLFSSEMLTGRRLLSTNLIYKALEPQAGYEIRVNGSISTVRRAYQPGFERVVILQLILSLAGWGALAFSVSRWLRNPLAKALGAALVLLFAYTPHMADWDSILMSESLTFSLFALQLAILAHVAFVLHKDPAAPIGGWTAAWAAVFFLWMFLRDTNLFTALATIGLFAALLGFKQYRKNKSLRGALAFLVVIFLAGLWTASQSVRSQVQLVNIYQDDLFPHESRVATLMEFGMPAPDSPEYTAWFSDHASATLIKFMLAHPGYPTQKIINDFPMAFDEIKQTYFKAPELDPAREWLMRIGDALHPQNTTPFLMAVILLAGMISIAWRTNREARPWAWLGLWLFLTASVTMIPTILGDTWALNRHALFSTMIYRLCMWLFAVVMMDLAISNNTPNTIENPT